MKLTRIFLDLDDVLNNFTPYVLWRLECECNGYEDYPIEAGWDIPKAASILHPVRDFTPQEFWSEVTREMWATVPTSPEFDELLDISAKAVGKENVFILTSPTFDPECLAGKLEWIQKYCPKWIQRQYMIGPRKYICALPGALLIDDNEDNVIRFKKCGGDIILVPRPWNKLHKTAAWPYVYSWFHFLFPELTL